MKLSRCLLMLFCLSVSFACASAKSAVHIIRLDGTKLTVQVEIADTPAKRKRGLMYRDVLPEGTGMLFIFPFENQHPFWMKDTKISLDMIFVRDKRIVDIIAEARPFSEELLTPKSSYIQVLEVPGGYAQKKHINVGDLMRN